jgi:hypothetical protein
LIHPDSELRFIDPAIGYGVFATSLIPKGTFTWVRDRLDQIVEPGLDTQLPEMLAALLHRYSYLEPRGRVLCWDQARFINHSCHANCRSTGFDLELAVRDIQPGEEITDDYGSLNVDYEFGHAPPRVGRRRRPGDRPRSGAHRRRTAHLTHPRRSPRPRASFGGQA